MDQTDNIKENSITYKPLGNIYEKGNEFTQQSLTKDARRRAKRKARAAEIAAQSAIPSDSSDTGRRLFTSAEKAAALERTGGICASCGKKLTVKTMTAEHVIPVSWGGTNEPENIIALCQECNKRKGGLLYLPEGFYTAITGTSAARRLENMFAKWFREECKDFDLETFPLIAPETNCIIVTTPKEKRNGRKAPVAAQFILQWGIVRKDREKEVEDLTGMTVEGIRKRLCDLEETGDQERVALYTLKKLSTDHTMILAAIMYREEEKKAAVWVVWSDTKKCALRIGTENLCSSLVYALVRVAGRELTHYNVYSNIPGALDGIREGSGYPIGLEIKEIHRSGVADSISLAVIPSEEFDPYEKFKAAREDAARNMSAMAAKGAEP